MTDSILPEGEMLRKALTWISEMRRDNPDRGTGALIDEAGMRFNLSPRDQVTLARYLSQRPIGDSQERE